jgi:hypothetical protein
LEGFFPPGLEILEGILYNAYYVYAFMNSAFSPDPICAKNRKFLSLQDLAICDRM